jgi:hypothetical protein
MLVACRLAGATLQPLNPIFAGSPQEAPNALKAPLRVKRGSRAA